MVKREKPSLVGLDEEANARVRRVREKAASRARAGGRRSWHVDEVLREGAFVRWKISTTTPWKPEDENDMPPVELEVRGVAFTAWGAQRVAMRAVKRANDREDRL